MPLDGRRFKVALMPGAVFLPTLVVTCSLEKIVLARFVNAFVTPVCIETMLASIARIVLALIVIVTVTIPHGVTVRTITNVRSFRIVTFVFAIVVELALINVGTFPGCTGCRVHGISGIAVAVVAPERVSAHTFGSADARVVGAFIDVLAVAVDEKVSGVAADSFAVVASDGVDAFVVFETLACVLCAFVDILADSCCCCCAVFDYLIARSRTVSETTIISHHIPAV